MTSDRIYHAALADAAGVDWDAMDERELARWRDDLFGQLLDHFPAFDAPDIADAMDEALTSRGFPFDRWQP